MLETFVTTQNRAKLVVSFLGPASPLFLDILIDKSEYSVGRLNKPHQINNDAVNDTNLHPVAPYNSVGRYRVEDESNELDTLSDQFLVRCVSCLMIL